MLEQSRLISVRFGDFFKSLPRNEDGIAEFGQQFDNMQFVFRHSDRNEPFMLKVFLDMVQESSEGHDHKVLPVIEYTEEDDEFIYHRIDQEIVGEHFFNESTLLVPALISQVEQRQIYLNRNKQGSEYVLGNIG
jgi:hypothetical protein